MEIVLLVAILAVAGSALYVAFMFKNHLGLLARRADLDPLVAKAASDIAGQVTTTGGNLQKQLQTATRNQDEQVSALQGELNRKLEKLDRQVWKLGTSLARQRELIAGLENHVMGKEAQGVDPREMDALESALLHAEAYVAAGC